MASRLWLLITGATMLCGLIASDATAQLLYVPEYYSTYSGGSLGAYRLATWGGGVTIGDILSTAPQSNITVGGSPSTALPSNLLLIGGGQSSSDRSLYTSNYNEGHDAGYAAGYTSGFATGSERGTSQGASKGDLDGNRAGYDAAYQPAYDAAYDTSFGVGRADGFNNGICRGFENGFDWAMAAAMQEAAGGSLTILGGVFSLNGYSGGTNLIAGTLSIDLMNSGGGWWGSSAGSVTMNSGVSSIDWAQHYYDEGFADGKKSGVADGDAAGFDATYATAYAAAYDSGFQIGSSEGTSQGTSAGSSAGYSAGNDVGWTDGLDIGFDAGVRFFLAGGKSSDVGSAAALFSADLSQAAAPEPSAAVLVALAGIPVVLRRARRS